MEYGTHLPIIALDNRPFSLALLREYTVATLELGYSFLCANDTLLFPRPWLDGPTALASVIGQSGDLTLVTTVSLPVLRGPVPMSKTLAALDVLSGGRLIAGVGSGSSEEDYATIGIPFSQRWRRFDESVMTLRSLLNQKEEPFEGSYYSTNSSHLEPYPIQKYGLPIWLGTWGSEAGLQRTAKLADGWIASAFNTTADEFKQKADRLNILLQLEGKDPNKFPNALATMFMHISDSSEESERIPREVLSPALGRSGDELVDQLLLGPPEVCAEKLSKLQSAGVQRVFLWPLTDEIPQLEMFQKKVAPLVP